MSQSERRHERLAVRLSLIISRLVAGETLAIQTLAAEFGVSVRTLRRDFRERLAYLDLEFRNGQCRLLSGSRQRELTVQTFVRPSGVAALFPRRFFGAAAALAAVRFSSMAAWAAARRATGTRYGLQLT